MINQYCASAGRSIAELALRKCVFKANKFKETKECCQGLNFYLLSLFVGFKYDAFNLVHCLFVDPGFYLQAGPRCVICLALIIRINSALSFLSLSLNYLGSYIY